MKTTKILSTFALIAAMTFSACNSGPVPPPAPGIPTDSTTVTPPTEPIAQGEGTLEKPYNASQAKDIAIALGENDQRADVYVSGYVSSIKKIDTGYGNAEYSISDDGTTETEFAIYRGYYLNGNKFTAADQLKVGDVVVILGTIVNYKGNTPQITQGSKIVKHNGQEAETVDYENAPAKTVQEFIAAADKNTYFKLTGSVSGFNPTYCSFDLTDATGKIYVYRVDNKAEWSSKISNGGTVVLAGKYDFYESKSQHEVVNAQILSFTAGEGGGEETEPIAEPTSLTKVTIQEFLEQQVSDSIWYELTGKIINIEKQTYGNFTIEDETGSVYVFGLTSKWIGVANDQSFATIGLKVNDVVTFGTLRQEHNGSAQAGGNKIAAYYISHVAGVAETLPAGSVVLTFPDDNKDNNNAFSAYDKTWTAKKGEYEFNIVNFNNNKWGNDWTHIRCGSKNFASVASIANVTAMPKIAYISMTVDKVTTDKVNSIVLGVYSDAALTNQLGQNIAPKDGIKVGDLRFEIPAEIQADKLYYKITVDCQQGKENGLVQVSKVTYAAAE